MWMKKAGESLDRLRREKPIVHHITNFVTVHDCANAALAIGASPIMANHPDEVYEVVKLAKSLVINIGTLQPATVSAITVAVEEARKEGIPVVLDPVGIGVSRLRQETVRFVVQQGFPQIIKGNAGEISSLYRLLCENVEEYPIPYQEIKKERIGAIDSAVNIEEVKTMAVILAKKYKNIIAVTGEKDIVTDGDVVVRLHNGTSMLPKLTGTGCMTTTLVGAFMAVSSPLIAAIGGITCMSIAGEHAFRKVMKETDYGSFSMALQDSLGAMVSNILYEEGRIESERE